MKKCQGNFINVEELAIQLTKSNILFHIKQFLNASEPYADFIRSHSYSNKMGGRRYAKVGLSCLSDILDNASEMHEALPEEGHVNLVIKIAESSTDKGNAYFMRVCF